MKFTNETAKKIEAALTELARLKEVHEQEKKGFIEKMTKEGWQIFTFYSFYYGTHDDGKDDKDIHKLFLFQRTVDISHWQNCKFRHGHHHKDGNNLEFREWLAELSDSHFIEIEVVLEED